MTQNVIAMNINEEDAINQQEEAIIEWEQRLDFMGHAAPIEELKTHLASAPSGAPSKDTLAAFIAGHDEATRQFAKAS